MLAVARLKANVQVRKHNPDVNLAANSIPSVSMTKTCYNVTESATIALLILCSAIYITIMSSSINYWRFPCFVWDILAGGIGVPSTMLSLMRARHSSTIQFLVFCIEMARRSMLEEYIMLVLNTNYWPKTKIQ
jgi:hypothetical protein